MSFRSRVLLVVVAASVLPLGLVGLWLTNGTVRSGDRFLENRLEEALEATVSLVSTQWVQLRSELLFFGEDPTVQRVLQGSATASAGGLPDLERRFRNLGPGVRGLEIRSKGGERLSSFRRGGTNSGPDSEGIFQNDHTQHHTIPIFEELTGARIGSLDVELEASALLPAAQRPPVTAGMVVVLEDAWGGVAMPPPFDAALLDAERFLWAGEEWVTARQTLTEPAVTVVLAATLGPFLASFEETARRGTLVLLVVALLALLTTVGLTARLTRSLRDLADAATAVAEGNLDRTTAGTGRDEVGAVGRAFNTMTQSLRHTLEQLAARESLASVGEFAAGLAHEVRNPLTAVQIDLQYVESQLPPDSPLREPQGKALSQIQRLDSTVGDALRVGRSGCIRPAPMDLRMPLQAAVDAALPVVEEQGASLQFERPAAEVRLVGDADALEQLFLNLLMNAAQAAEQSGRVEVLVSHDSDSLAVAIQDDGVGMPDEVRKRAFEPLFSTRGEGTGLGLPISRRIAVAHGGDVRIVSTAGRGTRVEVTLPRAGAPVGLSHAGP